MTLESKTQVKKIKVLQIGSGSMGTRRMRDLSEREDVEIALLEVEENLRKRAIDRFGLKGFSDIESAARFRLNRLQCFIQ